jgi:uncharacterized protein YggU (UPF0235/DUF167 family)
MRLFVTAKTRAKKEGVEQADESHFTVAVKEAPADGKANEAILHALADFLKIPKSRLAVISGHTGRHKVIEYE